MYNNADRRGAEIINEAGSPEKKEQKNSRFFKAVKERKLGQLANEPLEKYVSALARNGVRLYETYFLKRGNSHEIQSISSSRSNYGCWRNLCLRS